MILRLNLVRHGFRHFCGGNDRLEIENRRFLGRVCLELCRTIHSGRRMDHRQYSLLGMNSTECVLEYLEMESENTSEAEVPPPINQF